MWRKIMLYGFAALAGLVLYGALRATLGFGLTMLLSVAALIVVGFVIYRNLQTNRKVPDATPEMRQRALLFTPDPGKAALYLVRTQFVGKAVGMSITINGRDITQLKSPRFTRVDLAPGAYSVGATIAAQAKSFSELTVNANAGDVIVVQCAMEPQMIGSICKLVRVDLDKTRKDIERARMVAPDASPS
ncbi:MAG: hypothetical protein JNM59_00105 [Hyphomonadaceae bacterium]|nr:hypothetical protein [Hyphomonadaceae bacterium]